jgi:HEAT repeats
MISSEKAKLLWRFKQTMKKLLLLWCAAAITLSGWSRDVDFEHRPIQVGAINYFGYGGLSLDRVRSVLPLHVGDTLTLAVFSEKSIDKAVWRAIGKVPTDVNPVCCDDSHRLLLFIGLPGRTSRPFSTNISPSGKAKLDANGMDLYDQDMAALKQAVENGSAGEDDSLGYMVSKDPKLKAVNLAMRAYAVGHEHEIRSVLQNSRSPKHRRAAAALLGYVEHSPAQVEALVSAIEDPDELVRNNAVRALSVLFAAPGNERLEINVRPLINLLYSGVWTDRNKACFLLWRMTDSRDPKLLESLRREAIGPLVEGALWTGDPGHTIPFLIILGRIGSLSNSKIDEMLKNNDVGGIISAALSSPSN